MKQLMTAAAAVTAMALTSAQEPVKVGALSVAPAVTIADISTDQMKGEPSRLAWSPDGTELYVQMMDGEFARIASAKLTHHLYKVADRSHQQVPAEPEWVAPYWTAKSGQTSPDGPALKIELKSEVKTQKTVSTPMGGDLAKGGVGGTTGTSAGDGISAAYNQQAVPVHTMRLRGEVVGEYVNSVIVPGQTFGWGPRGSKVIAYSAGNGRLAVMDENGTKRQIDGTKDVAFPAWSPDGKRLAWLEKDGKKKYVLKMSVIG
jgi:hypothetical protein